MVKNSKPEMFYIQKLQVSPSVGRESEIGWVETLENNLFYQYETITIKKSPNFENKFFADFRKNNQR
ncbi:hypothetical protein T12_13864 [Trichinella patagoniensis]|uniref:Uncharacterized protein n=1 Tax=Trichinella patagoniensis TaxID=990121 RepID=A0A0V0Z8J4_9BILA|nr:hypothetical protein T12_13864 [Trichinella patagoniensis]